MTREKLTENLAYRFDGIVEQGRPYWDLLADHTATKTREMGRVTGYQRAGIRYVQVQAYLDDRTSPVCRNLHGRIIPVSAMATQRDSYLHAMDKGNTDAAIKAWRMHPNASKLLGTPTKALGKNTAMPPYHFRCRTITVAYFPHADTLVDTTRRNTYNRERLPKKQVTELLARAKQAQWDANKLQSHVRNHSKELGVTNAQYEVLHKQILNKPDKVFTTIHGMRVGTPQVVAIKQIRGKSVMAIVDIDSNMVRTVHPRKDKSKNFDAWKYNHKNVAIVEQHKGGFLKMNITNQEYNIKDAQEDIDYLHRMKESDALALNEDGFEDTGWEYVIDMFLGMRQLIEDIKDQLSSEQLDKLQASDQYWQDNPKQFNFHFEQFITTRWRKEVAKISDKDREKYWWYWPLPEGDGKEKND